MTRPDPVASRPHMPGYGILDAGKGLLPWSWAEQRLTEARNYWLSTTRPDGRPHIMPVWGVWLHGAFWFSTGRTSRKARNLSANPSCVICPEGAAEAVIVEGAAAEVTDASALQPFIEAYAAKYDWSLNTDEGPFYVVRPRVAFAFIESADDFTATATRWRFRDA